MDLNLTAEQRELRSIARQFFAADVGRGDRRNRTNGDFDHRTTYSSMATLGWTGLTIPDEYGGSGGDLVDLAVVIEEAGRAGAVTPLIVCSAYGAAAVTAARNVNVHRQLVERIVNGSVVVTVGHQGGRLGRSEWATKRYVGQQDQGDTWLFSGRSILVPFAHQADIFLAALDLEGRGPSLALVPSTQRGVTVTRQKVIGGEPRSAVVFDRVRLEAADILAFQDGEPPDVMDFVSDVASLLYTVEAVGAAESALQLAVEHAKVRVQFGKPIGSFQTVSNRCTDMRLAIDAARLLCWEAACSLEGRKPYASERVAVAKSYMNSTAQLVITNALQVHGGIGYSTEYGLHGHIRSLKAYQLNFGASRETLATVATALGI